MALFTRKDILEKLFNQPGREAIKKDLWFQVLEGLPFHKRVTVPLATWQALGAVTTGEVDIFELPAGAEIVSCFMDVTTEFAGTAITAATVSMGPSGGTTTLQTAQDAFSGTGLLLVIGTDLTTDRGIYSMSADTTIQTTLTLTGGNADALTQGEVDFYITFIEHAGLAADPLP
jgi:hypothetical protein